MEVPDRPSAVVERGFAQMFDEFAQLSDFIFKANDIGPTLGEIRDQARAGNNGPNDWPSIWLRRFVRALREEVDELEESIAWKWWRKDSTDLQNVRVELVDVFHFVITAAVAAGMTGEDFVKVCYEKRKLNFDRQVKGFVPGDNLPIGKGVPGA